MIAFDTNVLIYACDKADPARQADLGPQRAHSFLRSSEALPSTSTKTPWSPVSKSGPLSLIFFLVVKVPVPLSVTTPTFLGETSMTACTETCASLFLKTAVVSWSVSSRGEGDGK